MVDLETAELLPYIMTATITFVRHGNTDANVERWLQGQTGNGCNAF